MNILILHNKVPYPPKDGGAIAVWNTAVEMAQQEHRVTLLCMNTPKHYFPIEQLPENIHPNLKIIAIDVDSSVKPFGLLCNFFFSSKAYHSVRFHSQRYKEKFIQLLKTEQYDVVLYEGLFVLPYINYVPKNIKAFHVFRAHNIEHEIWQRVAINESNFFKKNYLLSLSKRLRNLEKLLINKVDLLLTLTARDEEKFRLLGFRKLSFISQAGIDLSCVQVNRFKINYPSIFFIGALDWLPNQEGLLWFIRNLWQDIHLRFPDLVLEIAGRNAPHWLVRKLEEYSNIQFYGEIDDAHQFMQERAIMLVPIFSGSGMRIKIIEGMAWGKTIITTSIGTEGIDTTHNKNIIIADSAEQFKNEIIRLLNDKDIFERIGIQAHQFILEKYNIKNIVEKTTHFIEKAILS